LELSYPQAGVANYEIKLKTELKHKIVIVRHISLAKARRSAHLMPKHSTGQNGFTNHKSLAVTGLYVFAVLIF